MIASPRNHFAAVVASIVCTVITIGFSVAPAVGSVAGFVA